jgi:hypothetical protein
MVNKKNGYAIIAYLVIILVLNPYNEEMKFGVVIVGNNIKSVTGL